MPDKKKANLTTKTTTGSGQEQGTGQDFGSNSENQQALSTPTPSLDGVPRTEEAVLAAARAACGDEIEALEALPKKADERLTPFVDAFDAMEAGQWTPEAGELWSEFLATAKTVAIDAKDDSGVRVRKLYDGPFTELMEGWIATLEQARANDAMSAKDVAELAYMYRKVFRELSRDLMADTNAVKVLRARDMVKHGSPWGPSFESLFKKNREDSNTDEGAYEAIIGSSTKHDAKASQVAKGSGSGSGGGGSGSFVKKS